MERQEHTFENCFLGYSFQHRGSPKELLAAHGLQVPEKGRWKGFLCQGRWAGPPQLPSDRPFVVGISFP